MSRRGNNVRGPTSALTEFLKESGITAQSIARRAAIRQEPQEQPAAGPSNGPGTVTAEDAVDDEEPDEGFDSEHLDEEEEEQPAKKKRKLTKAAEAKLKAQAKAKSKAKKGKKGDDDEDYEDDEDDDTYTALSKSMRSNAAASGPKPPVGGFDTCARCSKQYTVTKYTIAAQPPPGYLCHTCAKAGGADPFKKPAAPRKRKAPANKRTVTNIEERRLPTLVSLCVQIISKHIEDVETLGDVGTANKDSIIRALSRSRSLTHENAGLFYNIENKSLTFYDATNLHPESLASLAMLNPNLTSLRLDFCGRMDDTVIDAWSSSLRSLTHLELLGPYLVRTPAWIAFFKANPQLEAFRIVQSPRFDLACMKALATSCKRLVDLRLKEVRLEDSFVGEIKKLKHLRALDLSDPPMSLSEDGLVTLVKAIGKRLEVLDLSGHDMLTDDFFKKGLRANASSLMSLTLNNLTELSDSGVAAFLADVEMPSLTSVSLSRVPELGDEALSALLECAGKTLTALNMNTWRNTTQDGLKAIARSAPALKKLDLGWNREFDDFAMKEILDGCAQLEEIKCWGCNRLTESCPRKRNVAVFGVESHLAA